MTVEAIRKLAKSCIEDIPVVVLGSGASVPHGIRGMEALADVLRDNLAVENQKEKKAWTPICKALAKGDGLEAALQNRSVPATLVRKIVELTWRTIATDDLKLLQRAATGEERFPLSELVEHLFGTTNTTLHIVTPNYDRVAEYAVDVAEHIHLTGFVPGLIRRRKVANKISIRKGNSPIRIVRIWKVHGSLDWFKDEQGQTLSLPLSDTLPPGLSPLIVTPGISKYERTYDEPFQSAVQGAYSALGAANAVLCIGYGFRDSHIQLKLVERCQQKKVPVVVLARTLTDDAKDFLRASGGAAYLAMEKCAEGTRFFTHEMPDGGVIKGRKFWSLDGFNNLFFRRDTNDNIQL